jgi:hypothetical protein
MHESMVGGAVLTNWLAILGVVSLMYWGFRIVTALMARSKAAPDVTAIVVVPPAAVAGLSVAVAEASLNDDIAVIAAAVYAMVGAHRIVHLEAERQSGVWAIEGRWMQQTSHHTRN